MDDDIQKWEYCIIYREIHAAIKSEEFRDKVSVLMIGNSDVIEFRDIYEALSHLGKHGWELVTVSTIYSYTTPDSSEHINEREYFFKRPMIVTL